MKIRNQKLLIGILAALFVVAAVLYFAVIRPLTAPEEKEGVKIELLDGEVMINDRLTNFYMYEPLERSSIQSIEIENAAETYKIYRDASDKFQLDGFYGLSFDPELFSSLVVTTGMPTVMMRVAENLDEAGFAEYGLDKPQARWTITGTSGETHTVEVGDKALTDGGYYVRCVGRNAVYFMGTTLEDTVLKPACALLTPILTAGMQTNDYFMVDTFAVLHGEEPFVVVERVPDDEKSDPNAIVEVRMLYPTPAAGEERYEVNDTLYYNILYNFIALQGDEVVAFRPTDEELEAYGLLDPAYTIDYTYKDYEFMLFVSPVQPDGSYYAVSNLYGYEAVIRVPNDKLSFLEGDVFTWIFPTPFYENIQNVRRITLEGSGISADYHLAHSMTPEETPVLDVTESVSGTVIPNSDVKNFREYYKEMLNITNQEYAKMSEADLAALLADETQCFFTMTVEEVGGRTNTYEFFRYYEESTGHISGGKVIVVVNGVGEFYTTNDLVNKIIDDTPRVLAGLDVDAYGQY